MDFNQYGGKPVQRFVIDSQTFYPGAFSYNILQRVFCKVIKNQIKTQDDYLQFGQYSFNDDIYDFAIDKTFLQYITYKSLQEI